MKYTIVYGRKVRVAAYDMLEISLVKEFDETTPKQEAFKRVKGWVESWIEGTSDELMEKAVPRRERR